MRRKPIFPMVLAGGIVAIAAAAVAAGEGGLVLFAAPRGRWLAEVRPDAPFEVIEEREGWKRVRVEGWVPARDTADAATQSTTPATAPPAAGPAQGKPWEYLFYIDFIGATHEETTRRALDHLGEYAVTLRVLGSYPRFKG